jgi:hypothetical protein
MTVVALTSEKPESRPKRRSLRAALAGAAAAATVLAGAVLAGTVLAGAVQASAAAPGDPGSAAGTWGGAHRVQTQ